MSATSSPKLLAIVNLIDDPDMRAVGHIRLLTTSLLSSEEDYVALISQPFTNNASTSYFDRIRKVNSQSMESLNASIADIVDVTERTRDRNKSWLQREAILGLLTQDLVLNGGQELPCLRVLVIYIDGDLPRDLVDVLLQASKLNLAVQMFIFGIRQVSHSQSSSLEDMLPNVNILLCGTKSVFEDISSDDANYNQVESRLLTILNFLSFQG